jgi:SanA protein
LVLALALGLAGLLATLSLIDLGISVSTRDAIATSIDEVEPTEVAIILGTSRSYRGKPNLFYRARIEAAAELYFSGRVRGILVSGDNATRFYNEPISMQKDLMRLGVPAKHITLDYAGFRTLDSMVRAKEVFGLDQVIVVSQRFHAARAIFLARRFGVEARGFAAADPPHAGYLRVRAREVLARAAAVLDIVTGQGPRFLGERETVRLREPSSANPSSEHPT